MVEDLRKDKKAPTVVLSDVTLAQNHTIKVTTTNLKLTVTKLLLPVEAIARLCLAHNTSKRELKQKCITVRPMLVGKKTTKNEILKK